jgi:hypothetical protein
MTFLVGLNIPTHHNSDGPKRPGKVGNSLDVLTASAYKRMSFEGDVTGWRRGFIFYNRQQVRAIG